MNVKNILCPVDFSDRSKSALAFATSLAKEHGAELHIVYSYEEPYAYTDSGMSGFVMPADMNPDKELLLGQKPTDNAVRYRQKFLIGSPTSTLVNYAKDNDIDLIVMATHGRTGLGRLLMGSVAEAVLRRASCPVMTLKTPLVAAEKKEGDKVAKTV